MKDLFVTVVGMKYRYGLVPFAIGKRFKCVKEPQNPYDSEAICVQQKQIGAVGYLANSVYTTVTGTKSAGRIYDKVKKKFWIEVLFMTDKAIICKVVEGRKEKNPPALLPKEEEFQF